MSVLKELMCYILMKFSLSRIRNFTGTSFNKVKLDQNILRPLKNKIKNENYILLLFDLILLNYLFSFIKT